MARARGGVINSDLQHRKTLFQLDGAAFGPFPRAKFRLDAAINLKSIAGLWWKYWMTRHLPRSGNVTRIRRGYGESGRSDKSNRTWTSRGDLVPCRTIFSVRACGIRDSGEDGHVSRVGSDDRECAVRQEAGREDACLLSDPSDSCQGLAGEMSAFFGEVAPDLQKAFAKAFHIGEAELAAAAKMSNFRANPIRWPRERGRTRLVPGIKAE